MLASTAEATTATALRMAPTKLRAIFIAPPFERRDEMWVKSIEPKKALTPTPAAYPEAPSTAGSNRLAKNATGRTQTRRRNFPRSHGALRRCGMIEGLEGGSCGRPGGSAPNSRSSAVARRLPRPTIHRRKRCATAVSRSAFVSSAREGGGAQCQGRDERAPGVREAPSALGLPRVVGGCEGDRVHIGACGRRVLLVAARDLATQSAAWGKHAPTIHRPTDRKAATTRSVVATDGLTSLV